MSKKEAGFVDGLLNTARNIVTSYRGTVGDGVTLADVSKIARVEPITLVSSNLSGRKEIHDILLGLLDMYAAHYLQAVSILSTELVDVRILKILDRVNPDRDMKTLLTAGASWESYEDLSDAQLSINNSTMCLESMEHKLTMIGEENSMSFEAFGFNTDKDDGISALTTTINKLDNFEKSAAAVGKVMNVRFRLAGNSKGEGGDGEVNLPVVVKLDTMYLPSEVMSSIVSMNAKEIELGPRFKAALAGRISFVKDFLLASDLIKAQKKSMIKDPTGYYSQLVARVNKSKMYSILSGNVSLSGISSIVVLTEEEEQAIARSIGGNLTNTNTRKIVFGNTSAFMIVVVNTEWERVTVFTRDIDGFSQHSFSDFKRLSDRGGDNVQDFLKAFQLNSPPSF